METDAPLIQVLAILAGNTARQVRGSSCRACCATCLSPQVALGLDAASPVPSQRRKVICVVQVLGLILTIAAVGAVLRRIGALELVGPEVLSDELVDTVWLWRHAA